jgi:phospholipase/carboxylesterase
MNRLQNLVDDELTALLPPGLAEEPAARYLDESQDVHAIFTPLHYERNYAYPLVVWLHGPDDDERQVTRIMPMVSARNYVGVGPRGTLESAAPLGGFRWSQRPRHIALAERGVLAAVAEARRWLNIAPERIFVAGFGCGGTMAFRMALDHPRLFAGVLSIGGALPTTQRPFAQLHGARRLRVFLASGRYSQQCPEQRVCDNLRLLHAAGMSINLRQYPCGDELTTHMLTDMDRWIMEQVLES